MDQVPLMLPPRMTAQSAGTIYAHAHATLCYITRTQKLLKKLEEACTGEKSEHKRLKAQAKKTTGAALAALLQRIDTFSYPSCVKLEQWGAAPVKTGA